MSETPTTTNSRAAKVFPVVAILMSLGVMLLAGEGILRLTGKQYIFSRVVSDPVLHHVHPPNFSYIAHHPIGEFPDHTVRFDSEGRVTGPDSTRTAGSADGPRIAFMGDSFVEALQFPYDETFVGLLARAARPGAVVWNYGVSSYSPLLYRLQWEHRVAADHPTHVILMLYGNDVWDDAQYAKHGVRNAQGEIVAVRGPHIGWVRRFLRSSYLFQFVRKYEMRLEWVVFKRGERRGRTVNGFLEEHPDLSPLTAESLGAVCREIQDSGAKLLLTAVPSKYVTLKGSLPGGEEQFADKVKAWARANGVAYLDLVPDFAAAAAKGPLFLNKDIHFNLRGHRVVAEAIHRAWPDVFPGDPVPPGPSASK